MSDPFLERFEALVCSPRNWKDVYTQMNWKAVESLLDTMPYEQRDSTRWKLALYNCICLSAPVSTIEKGLHAGIPLFSRPSHVRKMLHNADFDKFKFYVSKMDKIDGNWLSGLIHGKSVDEQRLLFLLQHGADPFVAIDGPDRSVYAKLQRTTPELNLQARFGILFICTAIHHERIRAVSPIGTLPMDILRSLFDYLL